MPRYDYACTECGHQFDVFQSFSDDALTDCPECDGRLRKVFNAVGVVFKGSGFYRNDSRSSSASSSGASSGPSASSGAGTTKPAAAKSDSGAKTDSAKKVPAASTS